MWNAECGMRNGSATVDSAFLTPHSALASMLNVALTGNIAAGKSTVVELFHRWGATIIDADALAREAQAPGGDVLVVNDIPLLFEALDPTQFDTVVLVDASPALRRTRLRTMRGLSNDEADRMIAAQMPAERKRAKSDFVIENEGSLKQLERRARTTFDELRHRAAVGAMGGRPARVLLLAAAEAREQPTLNPIAARYAEAGLAVRRVAGDAAAIEKAVGQHLAPDAMVATARAAPAAQQAWGRAGRPGVLAALSHDPDPVAIRLDLRPWGAGRLLLVEPDAAGLAPRADLFPAANLLP